MQTVYNTTKERLAAFIEEATGEYHDVTDYSRDELIERANWVAENSMEWYGEKLTFAMWAN